MGGESVYGGGWGFRFVEEFFGLNWIGRGWDDSEPHHGIYDCQSDVWAGMGVAEDL